MDSNTSGLPRHYLPPPAPEAPHIIGIGTSDHSLQPSWTGPDPATFDGSFDLESSDDHFENNGNSTTVTENTYLITGLQSGTQYELSLGYIDKWGRKSARANATVQTTGNPPPPPTTTIPHLIGTTLAVAYPLSDQAHLQPGQITFSAATTEIRNDHLQVDEQDPQAGAQVAQGSKVDLRVHAIADPVPTYSKVTASNETDDAHSVDLYLIDLASPSIAAPLGALAYQHTMSIPLAKNKTYDARRSYLTRDGCPSSDPFTINCQRDTLPAIRGGDGTSPTYPWTLF